MYLDRNIKSSSINQSINVKYPFDLKFLRAQATFDAGDPESLE